MMTKKQAIELLRRANIATDIDKLRVYVEQFYINEPNISFDEFKSAVEVISDNEYTTKLLEHLDKDKLVTWKRYTVDIVKNSYYLEYWN